MPIVANNIVISEKEKMEERPAPPTYSELRGLILPEQEVKKEKKFEKEHHHDILLGGHNSPYLNDMLSVDKD